MNTTHPVLSGRCQRAGIRAFSLAEVMIVACILAVVCGCGAVLSGCSRQSTDKGSEKFVAQGDAFRRAGKLTEALWSYRQAAKAGNVRGAFAAGELLITQGQADRGRDRVLKLSEGLGYLFFAATNHHPEACAGLAHALQNGIGVQTNLVAAYAWLSLAAIYDKVFGADLDRLVVQLEPGDVLQAQKIAAQYSSGRWPEGVTRPVFQGDSRLAIQGLSVSGNGSLIVLNGGTLTVGERINVLSIKSPKHPAAERLAVSCCEIGADYALVSVAGEPNLKMLSIGTR